MTLARARTRQRRVELPLLLRLGLVTIAEQADADLLAVVPRCLRPLRRLMDREPDLTGSQPVRS